MFSIAAKKAKIPTSVYGWSGSYGGAEHYAFKEKHSDDFVGLDGIFGSGGGGTPTAEGIEFSSSRLRKSKAKKKIMVLITDGGANDVQSTRQQVDTARRQGVEVIGMAFGEGCDPGMMDEQFGPGHWVPIDKYTEAPKIIGSLIERRARKSASS